MLVVMWQILLLNYPIFKICFREAGHHHEDNDGDVETGEDVVKPGKHKVKLELITAKIVK